MGLNVRFIYSMSLVPSCGNYVFGNPGSRLRACNFVEYKAQPKSYCVNNSITLWHSYIL